MLVYCATGDMSSVLGTPTFLASATAMRRPHQSLSALACSISSRTCAFCFAASSSALAAATKEALAPSAGPQLTAACRRERFASARPPASATASASLACSWARAEEMLAARDEPPWLSARERKRQSCLMSSAAAAAASSALRRLSRSLSADQAWAVGTPSMRERWMASSRRSRSVPSFTAASSSATAKTLSLCSASPSSEALTPASLAAQAASRSTS
mmetsp:Transcript_64303/g.188156  ORF Transcript_64303/g.188156 Transcript_64303/m.188156 type:complete len:217 (+) Transcript_64303:891-1541(+)